MKDSAEQSNPSTGSVQPLAWAVVCPTGEPLTVRWTWHECLDVAGPADEIIPLYRQTQPTLTDAEREAVERAVDWLDRWQQTHGYHSSESGDLATLRGLLTRMGGE